MPRKVDREEGLANLGERLDEIVTNKNVADTGHPRKVVGKPILFPTTNAIL